MSLCIANLQRFIKWSTFVRVLNPKQDLWASKPWVKFTINVYTFLQWFAALYHLEDLIVASKTVKNRIFLSSEGYLIVFFYLFTSWQDIFFSFRVSLTKWLFVFRNLLRPEVIFVIFDFTPICKFVLQMTLTRPPIPWKSSGPLFYWASVALQHWLKASCSRTFWGKGSASSSSFWG